MQNTEAISAFLDNEPFDAHELAAALSDPDGRDTLIQLIGLRHIVQPPASDAAFAIRPPRRLFVTWLRAAVVLLAIGAGYAIGTARHGESRGTSSASVDQTAPPTPTVVVAAAPDARWEPVKEGQ